MQSVCSVVRCGGTLKEELRRSIDANSQYGVTGADALTVG